VESTSLKHNLGMVTNVSVKEHDEILEANHPQINPKQLLVQEDFTAWFWSKRQSAVRNWNWIIIFSNLSFQIPVILSPPKEQSFRVNLVYTAISFVNICLQVASYYVKDKAGPITFNLLIIGIRNAVRIIDFEETKFELFN